jgi:cobaltochelatase CobN
MAQEREARVLDPGKVPLLRQRILEAVRAAALEEELQLDGGPVAFERLVARLEGYLDELQQATIRDGLHVLGCPPRGEQRTHLLQAMLRAAPAADVPALSVALEPLLDRTADELAHLLTGLRGGFVPPGPSGSPTRGMWNVLPTGRNFYSVDPQAIPSRTSWEVGWRLAVALLERHRLEAGTYPQTVGLVVWGTAVMRTHGDDVAQALALLGVRPVWQPQSGRVSGLEVIPLAELGRPRIDVTLHLSGFFRDAFPHLVELLDDAVTMVAALDEPEGENYVAAHVRRAAAELQAAGIEGDEARRRASYRLFGSKPGCYGAGLLPLIDEQHWRTTADLARAYETWSAYAYGRGVAGRLDRQAFRARFGAIEAAVKNQDNREHDLFDSDDYFQYHGGMIATARAIRGDGGGPRAYFGDSADPRRPVVRDLAQEARRVFRSRVVNPRWLAAMRRHGYKGAFEMAATVDYLFGYDATTGVIADWMYERLAAAYILDREQQAFVARSNPWALRDMAERLLEAAARGLWRAPAPETLHHLRRVYLEADGRLEAAEAPAAGVGR